MRLAHIAVVCALLLLVPLAAQAGEQVVKVTDFEFTPAEIQIYKGDVVRWVWESGAQTVTDGDPENLPEAGARFDAFVNAQNQEFVMTFDETGDFTYFSRSDTDVKGRIHVLEGTPVDRATWSWIKHAFENPASANRKPSVARNRR